MKQGLARRRTGKNSQHLSLAATAALACIFMPSAAVRASTYTWATPADGSWSNPASWSEGSAPASASDTNIIFTPGNYTASEDLGSLTLNSLTFNNTDPTTNVINSANFNLLTFDGATPSISVTGGSASISQQLTSTAGMQITNSGAGTLLLNSQIFTGTTTITNSGPGTITLNDSAGGGPVYYGTNVLLNLANTGPGTLNLGNIGPSTGILNSGVSGTVNISAGAVTFAGSTSGDLFGNALILNVASGASFNFANNGETFGGLTGAGNVILGTAGLSFVAPGDRSFSGNISGTGGVTQNVASVLTLSGTSNSYSGTTTVTGGGTIRTAVPFALSPNSVVNVVNGLLDLNGYGETIAGLSGGNNLGQSLALNSSVLTINPVAGKTYNFYSGIVGSVNVVIGGAGTESLLGQNAYTGSTNVSSGTLKLNGVGLATSGISVASGATLDAVFRSDTTWTTPLTGSGAFIKEGGNTVTFATASSFNPSLLTVAAGTIVLDHTADNGSKLGTNPPVLLGSGGISLLGNNSSATSQTFNGLTLGTTAPALGGAGQIAVTSGAGQSATVSLGAITRNVGATIDFNTVNPSGGSAAITTTSSATNGILGGYATVNQSDWAALTGSNITAYTGYATTLAAGNNTSISSSTALSATTTVTNSLRFGSSAAVTFSAAANTLNISSGGILVPPGTGATSIGATGTAGKLISTGNELIINDSGASPLTISSVIAGTSSVTKTGSGTLLLNAANTYTGTTYLTAGTLQVSASNNLGNAAAPLVINGGTLSIPTGTIGTVSTTAGSVVHPITIGPAGATFNFGTSISWTGNGLSGTGTITKNGAGTWSVGSNGSTFSGNVIMNAGIIRFTSSQFGSATGLTINSGAQYLINDDATGNFGFAAGAPVNLTGVGPSTSAASTPGAFILTDQSPTGGPGVSPLTTFTNPITLTGDTSVGVYNGSSTRTASLIFSSAVSGPGSLIKLGTGILTLTNPSNGYGGAAGTTVLSNGTLRDGVNNALPVTTTLQFGQNGSVDPGTYDLNGFNQTLAGLTVNSGTGHQILNSNLTTPSTLTVNYNGTTPQTFGAQIGGGTVSSPAYSNLSLVKSGTGTLTLTGSNTFTGPITVAAGSLRLTQNNNSTVLRDYSVSDGASLIINTTDASQTLPATSLTVGSAGTTNLIFELAGNPSSSTGPLSVTGNNAFTLNGNVNVTVASTQTLSTGQYPLITYNGALAGAGFSAINAAVALPNRVIGSLINDVANHSIDLSITGVDFLKWSGAVSSDWDINTTQNWKLNSDGTPTKYLESPSSDAVTFDQTSAGNRNVNLVTKITPASVTVTGSADYAFGGAGYLAGMAALSKSGTGTLTLLTNNTYTGATSIAGGAIQVGNGGTTGSLGTGDILDNGLLSINRSDDLTLSQAISGSGSLTKSGSNTVTVSKAINLTGDVSIAGGSLSVAGGGTFAGNITGPGVLNINSGPLNIGNGGTTGTLGANVTLSNSGTLVFNRSDSVTYAGNISGNGNLVVANGAVKLTGSVAYDGVTGIGANALEFASDTDTTLSNLITGTGSLTKSGNGTLTILNANTGFTGPVTVNGGTILLADRGFHGALNTPLITINNGGKFIFGQGGIAGEDPNFPNSTYIAVNTGGIYEIRVGEVWGGASLRGGAFQFTGTVGANFAGVSSDFPSPPYLGFDLQSGTVSSQNGTGTITSANTGGGVIKTTTGTVSFSGPITISSATPIFINEGTLSFQSVNIPTTGTAALSLGGGPSQATLQLNDGGTATIARPVTLNSNGNFDIPAFNGTNGSLKVSGIVSGSGDLNLSGTGTMTLSGANTYTGNTNIGGGTLVLATTGSIASSPNVLVNSGTIFNIAASTSTNASIGILSRPMGNLNIAGGGLVTASAAAVTANRSVLIPTSISLAGSTGNWTGKLDLGANDMDVPNGNLATLTSQVKQGYNGAWNASGGINSTAAALDSTHLTAIGVIQNSADGTPTGTALYGSGSLGQFDGQSPASTDVLLKYTYFGDANLDGKIDGSDYSRIDANFGTSATGWYNGDFNYDGTINGSDYTLLDNAYNTQGAALAASIASPTASVTAEIAPATSAVPEPATVSLLALASLGLLGRRQRRTM